LTLTLMQGSRHETLKEQLVKMVFKPPNQDHSPKHRKQPVS